MIESDAVTAMRALSHVLGCECGHCDDVRWVGPRRTRPSWVMWIDPTPTIANPDMPTRSREYVAGEEFPQLASAIGLAAPTRRRKRRLSANEKQRKWSMLLNAIKPAT